MSAPAEHIVVLGQMGVGKTTVGSLLAAALGRSFFDSDEQIEAMTGSRGREIAETEGVARLHELELDALLLALQATEDAVVAAAASVVDFEEGRHALADVLCIWVDRDASGMGESEHRRIVDQGEDLGRRRPLFERLADCTLSGPGGPEEYVARALAFLDERQSA